MTETMAAAAVVRGPQSWFKSGSKSTFQLTERGPNAGDVGQGPGEARRARAFSEGDRGRRPGFRGRRAGLRAVQRAAGRSGPERLLLLRGLPRRGGLGGAPCRPTLRGLARGGRHARRAGAGDTLPDRVSRGGRLLDA